MRLLAAIAGAITALALPGTAGAQASYPEALTGGWSIAKEAQGDLTGDGIPEAVLVIRQADPALIVENDGLGEPMLDLNPRSLLVLERAGNGWRQLARADGLVPTAGNMDSPCLADPLEDGGVTVAKRILTVWLNDWLSCGSFGVTALSYKFRLEKGRFRLIGFDRLQFSRATGLGDETSINYLTGRRKDTSNATILEFGGGGEPAPRPEVSWRRIGRERHFLEEMDITSCEDEENTPSWC